MDGDEQQANKGDDKIRGSYVPKIQGVNNADYIEVVRNVMERDRMDQLAAIAAEK